MHFYHKANPLLSRIEGNIGLKRRITDLVALSFRLLKQSCKASPTISTYAGFWIEDMFNFLSKHKGEDPYAFATVLREMCLDNPKLAQYIDTLEVSSIVKLLRQKQSYLYLDFLSNICLVKGRVNEKNQQIIREILFGNEYEVGNTDLFFQLKCVQGVVHISAGTGMIDKVVDNDFMKWATSPENVEQIKYLASTLKLYSNLCKGPNRASQKTIQRLYDYNMLVQIMERIVEHNFANFPVSLSYALIELTLHLHLVLPGRATVPTLRYLRRIGEADESKACLDTFLGKKRKETVGYCTITQKRFRKLLDTMLAQFPGRYQPASVPMKKALPMLLSIVLKCILQFLDYGDFARGVQLGEDLVGLQRNLYAIIESTTWASYRKAEKEKRPVKEPYIVYMFDEQGFHPMCGAKMSIFRILNKILDIIMDHRIGLVLKSGAGLDFVWDNPFAYYDFTRFLGYIMELSGSPYLALRSELLKLMNRLDQYPQELLNHIKQVQVIPPEEEGFFLELSKRTGDLRAFIAKSDWVRQADTPQTILDILKKIHAQLEESIACLCFKQYMLAHLRFHDQVLYQIIMTTVRYLEDSEEDTTSDMRSAIFETPGGSDLAMSDDQTSDLDDVDTISSGESMGDIDDGAVQELDHPASDALDTTRTFYAGPPSLALGDATVPALEQPQPPSLHLAGHVPSFLHLPAVTQDGDTSIENRSSRQGSVILEQDASAQDLDYGDDYPISPDIELAAGISSAPPQPIQTVLSHTARPDHSQFNVNTEIESGVGDAFPPFQKRATFSIKPALPILRLTATNSEGADSPASDGRVSFRIDQKSGPQQAKSPGSKRSPGILSSRRSGGGSSINWSEKKDICFEIYETCFSLLGLMVYKNLKVSNLIHDQFDKYEHYLRSDSGAVLTFLGSMLQDYSLVRNMNSKILSTIAHLSINASMDGIMGIADPQLGVRYMQFLTDVTVVNSKPCDENQTVITNTIFNPGIRHQLFVQSFLFMRGMDTDLDSEENQLRVLLDEHADPLLIQYHAQLMNLLANCCIGTCPTSKANCSSRLPTDLVMTVVSHQDIFPSVRSVYLRFLNSMVFIDDVHTGNKADADADSASTADDADEQGTQDIAIKAVDFLKTYPTEAIKILDSFKLFISQSSDFKVKKTHSSTSFAANIHALTFGLVGQSDDAEWMNAEARLPISSWTSDQVRMLFEISCFLRNICPYVHDPGVEDIKAATTEVAKLMVLAFLSGPNGSYERDLSQSIDKVVRALWKTGSPSIWKDYMSRADHASGSCDRPGSGMFMKLITAPMEMSVFSKYSKQNAGERQTPPELVEWHNKVSKVETMMNEKIRVLNSSSSSLFDVFSGNRSIPNRRHRTCEEKLLLEQEEFGFIDVEDETQFKHSYSGDVVGELRTRIFNILKVRRDLDEGPPLETDPNYEVLQNICKHIRESRDMTAPYFSWMLQTLTHILFSCADLADNDSQGASSASSPHLLSSFSLVGLPLLTQMQLLYVKLGVPEIVLESIKLCTSGCPQRLTIFRLGIYLLKGGNRVVQKAFLDAITKDPKNLSLRKIRGILLEIVEVIGGHKEGQMRRTGRGSSGSAVSHVKSQVGTRRDEKQQAIVQFASIILRFMQLLCEGHNSDMQRLLRSQPRNSVDIISEIVGFILFFQEDMWSRLPKGAGGVDVNSYTSYEMFSLILDMGLASQGYRTLAEFMQGPCLENQSTILDAKACDFMEKFLEYFNFSKTFGCDKGIIPIEACSRFHLPILLDSWHMQANRLQSAMLGFLLSLMEGNHENGARISDYVSPTVLIDNLTYHFECRHLLLESRRDLFCKRRLTFTKAQLEALRNPAIVDRLTPSVLVHIHDFANVDIRGTIDIEFHHWRPVYKLWSRIHMSIGLEYYKVLRLLSESSKCSKLGYDLNKWESQHNYFKIREKVARIEVVREDKLEVLLFNIPNVVRDYWKTSEIQAAKQNLYYQVDRSNPEDKLRDFLHRTVEVGDMLDNLDYVASYNKSELFRPIYYMIKARSHWRTIGFLVTVLINILLLSGIVEGDSSSSFEIKESHRRALTALGTLHLILAIIMIFTTMVVFVPVRYKQGCRTVKKKRLRHKLTRPMAGVWAVLKDEEISFLLLYTLFSFIALSMSPLFYCVHLLDIFFKNRLLNYVMRSVFENISQLGATMVLGITLIYIFTVIGYSSFRGDYEFDEGAVDCTNLWNCFLGHLDYGMRGAPVWIIESLDLKHYVFTMFYNILIILILVAIISGIIIDTFSAMRDEKMATEHDMANVCFMCSKGRELIEQHGGGWEKHIRKEHNMWHYLFFIVYLKQKLITEHTGQESYVADLLRKNDISWMPISRSLALEHHREDLRNDEYLKRVQSLIEESIERHTDSMAKRLTTLNGGAPFK
eukprot:TRINITY_DN2677_c0_g2_i11.p1 TRINITY_DN2677_c0_g2~~TRINITY_DN2677_c0_g2_i11.p1  ORF type:complete len:2385 (+),score=429.24 TRINITY_DN2677_c0_g2_i11:3447-10601(+)